MSPRNLSRRHLCVPLGLVATLSSKPAPNLVPSSFKSAIVPTFKIFLLYVLVQNQASTIANPMSIIRP